MRERLVCFWKSSEVQRELVRNTVEEISKKVVSIKTDLLKSSEGEQKAIVKCGNGRLTRMLKSWGRSETD